MTDATATAATTSDFKRFVADAWRDHADDPRGVADRLPRAFAMLDAEPQVADLAGLALHVYGEHLAAWDEGDAYLQRLDALPLRGPDDGASAQALRRSRASLALAAGRADTRAAMSVSDRLRVGAIAASALAEHDTARAQMLFEQALEEVAFAGLQRDDPAHRALAVTGNNLACALEMKPNRSDAERDLMLLAARATRRHWEIAGGWLETERAEYRLAMSHFEAGDLAQARLHAQNCLEIVDANGGVPLERCFGYEALAKIERAAGNRIGHEQALAAARSACEQIEDAGDREFALGELAKLAG